MNDGIKIVIADLQGNWHLCDRHGASCDLNTKNEKRAIQSARFLCGENVKLCRDETMEFFPWQPATAYYSKT